MTLYVNRLHWYPDEANTLICLISPFLFGITSSDHMPSIVPQLLIGGQESSSRLPAAPENRNHGLPCFTIGSVSQFSCPSFCLSPLPLWSILQISVRLIANKHSSTAVAVAISTVEVGLVSVFGDLVVFVGLVSVFGDLVFSVGVVSVFRDGVVCLNLIVFLGVSELLSVVGLLLLLLHSASICSRFL